MSKVHLHEEQFDGHLHSWCGRNGKVAGIDEFEATDQKLRCYFCERNWFPRGQPDWHKVAAAERVALQKDAERYRWLREQKGLTLRSWNMIWTRPDGTQYVSTHYLAADGTQHASCETLDETIDVAMDNARKAKK